MMSSSEFTFVATIGTDGIPQIGEALKKPVPEGAIERTGDGFAGL